MKTEQLPLAPATDPDRVATLIFSTPPIDYVAETAPEWAAKGIGGFLRADIMTGWQSDVWTDADGARTVGADNPLLQRCLNMTSRLGEAGVTENFIVVPFSVNVPDWFDDGAWAQAVENFRQGARFARMAGFRGLALDDEYNEDQWGLHWAGYRECGHTSDELRLAARRRGREIQRAMLDEFSDMVTLHLPESYSICGELSQDMIVGFMDALATADAPGGMHFLTETTYFQTSAEWNARYAYGMDRMVLDTLEAPLADYWARRCGVAVGMAPLGYLRFIRDESGKRLGYGGRKEVFGDKLIASGEDKSGNYPAETFARIHAAARMTSRRYVWVFEPGPVWWDMTADQNARHGGPETALLPLSEDFDDYAESTRAPKVIDTPEFQRLSDSMRKRERVDVLAGLGMPRSWWLIGGFDNTGGAGFDRDDDGPEVGVDLDAEYEGVLGPVRWKRVPTPPMGYVDMSRLVAGGTEVQSYAVTWCRVGTPTAAVLRFASDDTGKVWLNGAPIHSSNTERIAVPDEDTVRIDLPAGMSEILVKIGNYKGGYGFFLRITDEHGFELPGMQWVETG